MIATAAATGWLITGSVSQDVPDVRGAAPTSSVARPTQASSAIPDSGFTEKLHERMKHAPAPARGRNPFAYSAKPVSPISPASPVSPVSPASTSGVEPARPVFKLSGIASDRVDDGLVLTAIIIDNGAMVFAKAGDRLSNGHSVVSVDETSVTLVDSAGVTQTLRLP